MFRTPCVTMLLVGAMLTGNVGCKAAAGTQPAGASENLLKDLEAAIETYPEAARPVLRRIVLAPGFAGVVSRAQALEVGAALSTSPRDTALALVNLARVYARTPISHYNVGAVAIGSSGAMYFGCNLEFLGQPLSNSVHGEQSAVMNAWVHGETGLDSIAITAAPCGYCRQFLNELATAANLVVLLQDSQPVKLLDLLPKAFGPSDLGVKGALMSPSLQPLTLAPAAGDATIAAALAGASASYSPYTLSYAGVSIESADGVVAAGRYAENAAYSPSMSPMQAALAIYNFTGRSFDDIRRAVLVQANVGTISQEDASRLVLRSINGRVSLESYLATRQ
ncbi:MAG: cytidine deaminase [Deltaproteobacteria bacterium]